MKHKRKIDKSMRRTEIVSIGSNKRKKHGKENKSEKRRKKRLKYMKEKCFIRICLQRKM
jgi:hypothetical protein